MLRGLDDFRVRVQQNVRRSRPNEKAGCVGSSLRWLLGAGEMGATDVQEWPRLRHHRGRDRSRLCAAKHARRVRGPTSIFAVAQVLPKGDWRNRRGDVTDTIHRADDGVWPREFQRDEYYSRAGEGGSSASPSISKSYYEQFRKSFEATRPESPSAGTVNSFRKPLVVRQNADADSCRPASGWLPLFYHSAMV